MGTEQIFQNVLKRKNQLFSRQLFYIAQPLGLTHSEISKPLKSMFL